MENISISTETIKLDQLLKWAGIVESGGQVRLLIEDELLFLNGIQVHERRKQNHHGDIIEIKGLGIWKVTAE